MNQERPVIIATEAGIAFRSLKDMPDVLGACFGTAGLLVTEADLAPEFFDLRSGLAGELFQKFSNYGLRLALVLPDPKAYGERISELAYEHTSHNLIRFFDSQEAARAWLSA